jgi:hypothetical protein
MLLKIASPDERHGGRRDAPGRSSAFGAGGLLVVIDPLYALKPAAANSTLVFVDRHAGLLTSDGPSNLIRGAELIQPLLDGRELGTQLVRLRF